MCCDVRLVLRFKALPCELILLQAFLAVPSGHYSNTTFLNVCIRTRKIYPSLKFWIIFYCFYETILNLKGSIRYGVQVLLNVHFTSSLRYADRWERLVILRIVSFNSINKNFIHVW